MLVLFWKFSGRPESLKAQDQALRGMWVPSGAPPLVWEVSSSSESQRAWQQDQNLRLALGPWLWAAS